MRTKRGCGRSEIDEDLVGGAGSTHAACRSPRRRWRKHSQWMRCSSGRSAGRNGRRSVIEHRPEAACRLRKESASLPTCVRRSSTRALADASSLKRELVEELDILILRELTGGAVGEPKEIRDLGKSQKRAIDTQVYDSFEIERISASLRAGAEQKEPRHVDGETECHEVGGAVERGGFRSPCA